MSFWSTKRVLVTGGAGFFGSFVDEKLQPRGAKAIVVPRSKNYDLVQMEAVQRLYKDAQPDIVLHLAARVGGIGANRANPDKFFYDNLMMGVQMMEVGRQVGIAKFVADAMLARFSVSGASCEHRFSGCMSLRPGSIRCRRTLSSVRSLDSHGSPEF
jgi:nucleoside-diphosphate-sugar epimerase